MKKLLTSLVLIIACNLWASSQELVADETILTEMKSGFKVETTNDSIFTLTLKKQEPYRYTVTNKKDRHGAYKEYILYYRKEDIDRIKKWFAKL